MWNLVKCLLKIQIYDIYWIATINVICNYVGNRQTDRQTQGKT